MNTMSYNGYQAAIEFDDIAGLFHGEVTGLRDVITFQGKSVAELKRAFKDSVEDYLAFCKKRGEEPEKPFSGQFVVRTDPQAHRLAAMAAKSKGMSLNAWVSSVIESASGVEGRARSNAMANKTSRSIESESELARRRPSGLGKRAAKRA